ncbi:hypothetical protein [Parabacteroides sp. FAFU027]|uniref:hypothetical protein n=1 Tax=Parabacteroides sp. FAFU027 TaxID=2922715 RepID=UPI001FAECEF4|nr:hypothetical protein [Parabacteroides sp. FAFU027]
MAFVLEQVVPWGRNLEEYRSMFSLSKADLDKKIISFGDGPASFNAEMHSLGNRIVSIDPIYQFSEIQLKTQFVKSREIVLEQTRNNTENFIWKNIRSIEELEHIRSGAMDRFLEDYPLGKQQGRYIHHELPEQLNIQDSTFDIGLSSHFLVLYDQLGLDFHIKSIQEMLRICKEIRIFPLLNLDAKKSTVLDAILDFFSEEYDTRIQPVDYEFQKGGNEMLTIRRKQQQ